MILKELFYDWGGLNLSLAQHIYSIRGVTYDHWMNIISQLGVYTMYPYYMMIIFAWAVVDIIYKFALKNTGRWYIMSWVVVLLTLVVGFGAYYVVINAFKTWFSYPRPFIVAPDVFKMLGDPLPPEKFNQSFPSGHAAFIAMMITGIWAKLKQGIKPFAAGFVVLMCWSRVSLGVHFPMDVITGAVIMFAATLMIRYILSGILRSHADV